MTFNKFLANLTIGAIFLILATPLVVSFSMFFPFITGKAVFFRLLAEIAFGGWLILALRDARYRPRWSPVLWSLVALVAVAILATVFSVNPIKSLWSNFERMEGLVTYLHLFAYFLALIGMLQSREWWQRFFTASVGVSVAVSLYALGQMFGLFEIHQSGVRLDATLGNATYLAVFLLFNIFLAAVLWWQQTGKGVARWLLLASLVLNSFVLYHTATRGAILGFLAGAATIALLLAIFKTGRPRQIGAGLLVGLVLLVGGFWLAKDSQLIQGSPVLSRFAGISLTDATTQSRLLIWQMSVKGLAERPLLGWGPDNFQLVFSRFYDPLMCRQEPWFDRAHNVFMDWLVTTGVLGAAAYLALFVSGAYLLLHQAITKRGEADLLILVGLLVAYGVNNLFVFDNLTSYLLFFSVLGYLHFLGSQEKLPISERTFNPLTINILAGVVVVLCLVSFYLTVVQPVRTSRALIRAISPIGDLVSADQQIVYRAGAFDQALALGPTGRTEIREQLAQAALQSANLPGASDQNKQAFINFAAAEMMNNLEQNPFDARPVYLLGRFLGAFGDGENALKFLNQALTLSPGKQLIMFDLASVYYQLGESAKTASILKEAYDLAPSCPESAVNYTIWQLTTGNRAAAREVLLQSFGTTSVDHERLQGFYQQQGVTPL